MSRLDSYYDANMIRDFSPRWYGLEGNSQRITSVESATMHISRTIRALKRVQPEARLTIPDLVGYVSAQFVSNQDALRKAVSQSCLLKNEADEVPQSALTTALIEVRSRNNQSTPAIMGRIALASSQQELAESVADDLFDVIPDRPENGTLGLYPKPPHVMHYIGRMTMTLAPVHGLRIPTHIDSIKVSGNNQSHEVLVGMYEYDTATRGRFIHVATFDDNSSGIIELPEEGYEA